MDTNNNSQYAITIFTPTYNRAYLLPKAYAAMQRQTRKDFVWLIVDDGSTDNTKELVEKWQAEDNEFRIDYVYKENGGLQSGYFEALKHIDTELCGCIDSDGYLADYSIEAILDLWNKSKSDKVAGVMGLDAYEGGEVVGGLLPEEMKVINLIDLNLRKGMKKDRVFFIRTDVYKTVVPPKRWPGEKTMNQSYLLYSIAKKYDFAVLNRAICLAVYDENGLTAQGWRRYFMRPNTYADWRLFLMTLDDLPLSFRIRNNIHFVAECLIAKTRNAYRESNEKLLTIASYPFGLVYYVYLSIKYKKYCYKKSRE